MKPLQLTLTALLFSVLLCSQTSAQKKSSLLSYNISFSDYNTPKAIRDSTLKDVLKDGDWFRTKKKSFGLTIGWWKSLTEKIDFSANLTGTFSNFPAYFIKGDDIGQASFTPQLDALFHLKAFTADAGINPFLTAGLGAGYFSNQVAAYAPLGAGLQFNFSEGAYLIMQMQWRKRLTQGITQDYLQYNIGFAQTTGRKKANSKPAPKISVPADKDGDGVTDANDGCPDVAGTINGCPDADKDDVADKNDLCPTEKGTVKGCPDADADGIADKDDNCKNTAGLARYKGCPIPDSDNDGINDEEDKCPDAAGTALNKGCPDIKPQVKEKVDFEAQSIQFKFASDELLDVSLKSLYEVASILVENPKLNLSIEAHADNRGLPERNMMWSERRAKAVADYFLNKGIKPERITYKGYGDTQPIADNKTEAGRSKNRRVEMKLSY